MEREEERKVIFEILFRFFVLICGFIYLEYKMNILIFFYKFYFSFDIWFYICLCYFNNNLFFNLKIFI